MFLSLFEVLFYGFGVCCELIKHVCYFSVLKSHWDNNGEVQTNQTISNKLEAHVRGRYPEFAIRQTKKQKQSETQTGGRGG